MISLYYVLRLALDITLIYLFNPQLAVVFIASHIYSLLKYCFPVSYKSTLMMIQKLLFFC